MRFDQLKGGRFDEYFSKVRTIPGHEIYVPNKSNLLYNEQLQYNGLEIHSITHLADTDKVEIICTDDIGYSVPLNQEFYVTKVIVETKPVLTF